ncbi:MAG TPA: outer membrane beta-barrel protein [Burkholderiales bacterium]
MILPVAGLAQPAAQEREISPDTLAPRAPGAGDLLIHGFAVGSANWQSRTQMVSEFAGGATAPADARQVNFRFDKVGVALSKRFASWLRASAALEIESHKDKHTHLRTNPTTQCVGVPVPCESFGAEAPSTEATLDKLEITAIAPIGTGLGFSFGRFDVPFGIERHDEVLNVTATASEIYHFAKPQNYTGIQTFYAFGPLLDVNFWVANRWESHTTHEPFDDNNKAKSLGGRIGFSPRLPDQLLIIGIGAWYGAERDNPANPSGLGLNGPKRQLVDLDVTWSPSARTFVAAELVYGKEEGVSFRARGFPFDQPAVTNIDPAWRGGFVLAHHEVLPWLGLTARYGYLRDEDAWRTGVAQKLQSITLGSTFHLSALIPGRPVRWTYPRTQVRIHEVDVKLEYRYNWSDQPVFSRADAPFADPNPSKSSHQLQVQLAVNF